MLPAPPLGLGGMQAPPHIQPPAPKKPAVPSWVREELAKRGLHADGSKCEHYNICTLLHTFAQDATCVGAMQVVNTGSCVQQLLRMTLLCSEPSGESRPLCAKIGSSNRPVTSELCTLLHRTLLCVIVLHSHLDGQHRVFCPKISCSNRSGVCTWPCAEARGVCQAA